jgi:hypothetical protein
MPIAALVKAFEDVRTLVESKASNTALRMSWRVCSEADQEHLTSSRQYAHVGHVCDFVCFAHAASGLGEGYLLGLCLHEFGHEMAMEEGESDDPEADADTTILEAFGLKMEYRGEGELEYVDPETFHRKLKEVRP